MAEASTAPGRGGLLTRVLHKHLLANLVMFGISCFNSRHVNADTGPPGAA